MRDQYMRGGEGFIICYSITDRQSFQEAAEFKELIYRVRHTYDIPLVLVGNKTDLEEFRQVSNLIWFTLDISGICIADVLQYTQHRMRLNQRSTH